MRAILYPVVAAMVLSATAIAADPSTELSEATAAKLIDLRSRNRTPRINVALILEGTTRSDAFETRHVRRVTAIHPVVEEGRQVRRVLIYDFQWSPTYGWFLSEKREEAGGETLWIWSESHGEVVVR